MCDREIKIERKEVDRDRERNRKRERDRKRDRETVCDRDIKRKRKEIDREIERGRDALLINSICQNEYMYREMKFFPMIGDNHETQSQRK